MYTDDQFQWITKREKFGPVVEPSNITELLIYSGAASHVRPCRMTAGFSYKEASLKATGYTGYIPGYAESEVPIG